MHGWLGKVSIRCEQGTLLNVFSQYGLQFYLTTLNIATHKSSCEINLLYVNYAEVVVHVLILLTLLGIKYAV